MKIRDIKRVRVALMIANQDNIKMMGAILEIIEYPSHRLNYDNLRRIRLGSLLTISSWILFPGSVGEWKLSPYFSAGKFRVTKTDEYTDLVVQRRRSDWGENLIRLHQSLWHGSINSWYIG